MKKEIKIHQCYQKCPFFTTRMQEMACGHPYFDGKSQMSSMIIKHHNSQNGKFPQECPLRIDSITIEYSLM